MIEVSAYILAGGRSSRMGRDKALVELSGRPLIAHAVDKLRALTPHVHILSPEPALASYASLVPDLHPGLGPIGGIEAALAHTTRDWNLLLPVDLPLLPGAFLAEWLATLPPPDPRTVVSLCRVGGIPQPAVLLIHRAAHPIVTAAIERGDYKLLPVLEKLSPEMRDLPVGRALWFTNINTPEDLAEAERLLGSAMTG